MNHHLLEIYINQIKAGSVKEGLAGLESLSKQAKKEEDFLILGEIFLQLGHLETADQLLMEILNNTPNHLEALLLLAEVKMESGEDDDAIMILSGILSEHPNHLEAAILLAEAYLSIGLPEVAEKYLLQAEPLLSDEPLYWESLYKIYYQMGKLDQALLVLEEIPLSQLDNQRIQQLSRLYFDLGEFEKAEMYQEKGLDGNPGHEKILEQLFYTKMALHKWGEAEQILKQLQQITFDESQFYPLFAKLYVEKGEIQQASDYLEKYMTENPLYEEGWMSLGKIYLQLGELEKAGNVYLHLLSISEGLPEVYQELSDIYFQLNQWEEAKDILHSGLKEHPFNKGFYERLAQISYEEEKFDRAISYLEKEIDISGGEERILNQLAQMCWENGQPDKAKEWWNKSLGINPHQEDVEEWLSRY